jgi:RNA polymerase sigma-70 factor (ECF subfamily)
MLAALVRSLGDMELAEEALQDAVAEALRRWPAAGVPTLPAEWLVAVARNRAIDRLRRRRTAGAKYEQLAAEARRQSAMDPDLDSLSAWATSA